MGPWQVLLVLVWVDMKIMLMKLKTPEMEPHNQMQFNVIPNTLNGFKYSYLTLKILFNIIH